MNPCENAAYITAIACQLYKCMDTDSLALLASDLVQLADTLAAMIVRGDICNKE